MSDEKPMGQVIQIDARGNNVSNGYCLLGPAYRWFTQRFDVPVLRRTRASLDELS